MQVLLNTLRGFAPQASLDAPRFCISAGLPDGANKAAVSAVTVNSEIWVEESVDDAVVEKLRREYRTQMILSSR